MSRNAWDFYIALEHREVDEALSHWGQYWRTRGRPPASCESLEGAYSGPQGKGHPTGWGDWQIVVPRPWTAPSPDIAFHVEQVMQVWAREGREGAKVRRALKFWYVYRSSPDYISQRLRVRLGEVQPLLYDGRQEVMGRLTGPKKKFRVAAQFEQVSGLKPCVRPMGGRISL